MQDPNDQITPISHIANTNAPESEQASRTVLSSSAIAPRTEVVGTADIDNTLAKAVVPRASRSGRHRRPAAEIDDPEKQRLEPQPTQNGESTSQLTVHLSSEPISAKPETSPDSPLAQHKSEHESAHFPEQASQRMAVAAVIHDHPRPSHAAQSAPKQSHHQNNQLSDQQANHTSDVPVLPEPLFFDRELSWLDFNARVLSEADNPNQPLLERLKFLAIFTSNLDEFFMIHIPGMRQRTVEESGKAPTVSTIRSQMEEIKRKLLPMLAMQDACLQKLLTELSSHDVHLPPYASLSLAEKHQLELYFESEVFPVLTPLAVDPGHPFPYISNLSISLAVIVTNPHTGDEHFARVKVPTKPALPRLVPVAGTPHKFVLLEEVITAHIGRLFAGMDVGACYPFRLTRNADLELQEHDTDDLLEMIEEELAKRRFGEIERLEIARAMPERVLQMLIEELEIEAHQVYTVTGMLNMGDLFPMALINVPELRDTPFSPGIAPPLRNTEDIFAVIRKQDVLLHHPYQAFSSVIDFLAAAAADPNVLTIKHTLYRTSGDSPILTALIDAADSGKQVACLVELKARFDEANNINWAKQLEKAGVHVVYGLVGLKTHSKVTLVVRREKEGIRRYLHIGTGNYNPRTAGIYTDVGILTCAPNLGMDATDLFNVLTGYAHQEQYRAFLVAPVTLRSRLQEMVEREAAHHTPENPGRIIAKMNALTDPPLIKALYAASQKGVKIDLIVRGMCCLRPGVPGLSDNIRVMSIVGRFLEHSRIFYFRNTGGDKQEIYIGSADWMTRNLDRRVEVVVPVISDEIRSILRDDVLGLLLRDNQQAWDLDATGHYTRRKPAHGEPVVNAQMTLLAHLEG